MRKFVLSLLAAACALGCSNTHARKTPIGNDAGSAEGSVAADSCDAGGIFNYSTDTCSACPAVVDAGGVCPPDGGSGDYQCTLTCSDVDFSKSTIDTTNRKIVAAFTNYPLALTGITSVYFVVMASAADGGFLEVGDQDYPTSIDRNILTMDLSKMPAAEFASITRIGPSELALTDACGRPNSEALDFSFDKSGSTFVGGCTNGGP